MIAQNLKAKCPSLCCPRVTHQMSHWVLPCLMGTRYHWACQTELEGPLPLRGYTCQPASVPSILLPAPSPPPALPELRASSQGGTAPLSDRRKQLTMSVWWAGKESPTVPLPGGLSVWIRSKENSHLFLKAVRASLEGEARPVQAALLTTARRLKHTATGDGQAKCGKSM